MAQETFADRLRTTMAERGLKQADLVHAASARGARLGKSQVSQYVSGKVVPRPNVTDLLADLLDVDAAWLSTGEGARAAARPETASQPVPTVTATGSVTMRESSRSPPSSTTSSTTSAAPWPTRPLGWRTRGCASSS